MLELTGIAAFLRGVGALYWLLAIGAVTLALVKGKGRKGKAIWASVAAAVFGFLPGVALVESYQKDAYAKEAWAYFRKKCEMEAGEKIYKTFTGVKSVLVVKPLPPATEKDLFDQFWYGDPYSDASHFKRAESAARHLTMSWKHRTGAGTQRGLEFVELKNEPTGDYLQLSASSSTGKETRTVSVLRPASRFGVAWEDISTPEDRKYWVAGSRFRVMDLSDNTVVAERIGFLIEAGFGSTAKGRRPWQSARGIGPNGRSCPDAHDATDQWFVTSVFPQLGAE